MSPASARPALTKPPAPRARAASPPRADAAAAASQGIRINRFLASAGVASRRACDGLIRAGAVAINGHRVADLATRVEPGDRVTCQGREIRPARAVTLLLHKPRGYVCTAKPQGGQRTVYDLLPPEAGRLAYAGRLDADSEGLVLFTSDGALIQRLAHPSAHVPKIYAVTLEKPLAPADADRLTRGMTIEGRKAKFSSVHPLGRNGIQVVLHQGLKRQIRVMLGALGYNVRRLVRVAIGPLRIHGLKTGRFRALDRRELAQLERLATRPAA